MSDSIIKLNDDNKRAFKCLHDCGWEIAATQSLRQTAIVIDAGVFGNPDDPCWKLLIASKLPMYYTVCSGVDNGNYFLINDPANMQWAVDLNKDGRIGMLAFDVDDYVSVKIRDFCVLLTSPLQIPDEFKVIGNQEFPISRAIEMICDKVCENYPGHIEEDFVQALVEYYKK